MIVGIEMTARQEPEFFARNRKKYYNVQPDVKPLCNPGQSEILAVSEG